MSKSNEFVGVNEEFIPEGEKNKQHTSESIISDETRDKLKDAVGGDIDELIIEDSEARIKQEPRKGRKVAKGLLNITYIASCIFIAVIVVPVIIVAFVFAVITIHNYTNSL